MRIESFRWELHSIAESGQDNVVVAAAGRGVGGVWRGVLVVVVLAAAAPVLRLGAVLRQEREDQRVRQVPAGRPGPGHGRCHQWISGESYKYWKFKKLT